MKLKKINFHCTKGFKKIAITRMKIKIEKKINFIFDWKVKLKRKINLVKGKKKFKRMRMKINIKNKNNVFIERWNWKELITLTKGPTKKKSKQ